jgi:hypothetical protein
MQAFALRGGKVLNLIADTVSSKDVDELIKDG